jgi:hypothetical protein
MTICNLGTGKVVVFEPHPQTTNLSGGFIRGDPPKRHARSSLRDHPLGQLRLGRKLHLISNSGVSAPSPISEPFFAEQHNKWTEGRRYMSLELLAKSRIRIVPAEPNPVPNTATMTTETLTA